MSNDNQTLMLRRIAGIVLLALVAYQPATAASFASSCADNSDPKRANPVSGNQFMVAAAHPLAVQAGCDVLKNGGGAMDAAVAVQSVLAVVEPQSSGLAGGALINFWDNSAGQVRFYEGLSAAPADVTAGLRTGTAQDELDCGTSSFSSSVDITGRSVGIPGAVRALDKAHAAHGRMAWQNLFGDSIDLADNGFPMSKYMNFLLGQSRRGVARCNYPDLGSRYCSNGIPKSVGATLFNAELADVLREVRDGGVDAFYNPLGSIAPAIVDRTTADTCKPLNGSLGQAVIHSLMTPADFASYQAVERAPVCDTVLGSTVCSSPPPAFGGTALLYILKLMELGGVDNMRAGSISQVHLGIEASRLAQWDRREYIGDPSFNDISVDELLDDTYLASRFEQYSPKSAILDIQYGYPIAPDSPSPQFADLPGDMTSHISIVDSYGDAVSMTATNNSSFGAHMEARGMILNNVQTNFTRLDSISPGVPVNIMESSKKPRTSMAPSLVFDAIGELSLVLGAAGGSGVPDYVAQTILGVDVFGMNPQKAINQGHYSGQTITSNCDGLIGAKSEVESGTSMARLKGKLNKLGHPCTAPINLRSGLSAVQIKPDGSLLGAADPRRDGVAMGE